MRISDWSSDVCSSDLRGRTRHRAAHARGGARRGRGSPGRRHCRRYGPCAEGAAVASAPDAQSSLVACLRALDALSATRTTDARLAPESPCDDGNPRSEEHTSDLQSLMRISYAVFSLKKQT